MNPLTIPSIAAAAIAAALAWQSAAVDPRSTDSPAAERASVILQAADAAEAVAVIESLGGVPTREFASIRSAGAELTADQRAAAARHPRVRRIWLDRGVTASGKGGPKGGGGSSDGGGGSNGDTNIVPDSIFPRLLGGPSLWAQGITGRGVGIAVVDTGVKTVSGLTSDAAGNSRMPAIYDALTGEEYFLPLGKRDRREIPQDSYGHGTHVSGVAVNSRVSESGEFMGVAPDATLIPVRALDDTGAGTYSSVIDGIDWVIAHRNQLGIRVLNLSLSAPPKSHYWDDPLNQAVMAAWKAGIVVVASAGNGGPDAMTIGVPGNNPYVITVGAMSDAVTFDNPNDDFLTSFSAAGPTHEGFVKPDVVAPGGHVISNMQDGTAIASAHPEYRVGDQYFTMSGTSQAAAVVSGVVALLLQSEPALTPDMVKHRLMSTARPAVESDGTLAYSVFQQGAGMVHALDALSTWTYGSANFGLDVDLDLLGLVHFGGRAQQKADGSFYLAGLQGDGFVWNDAFVWNDGFVWSDAFIWTDGFVWSDAFIWSDGYAWAGHGGWGGGAVFSSGLTETMSANAWVPQE